MMCRAVALLCLFVGGLSVAGQDAAENLQEMRAELLSLLDATKVAQ